MVDPAAASVVDLIGKIKDLVISKKKMLSARESNVLLAEQLLVFYKELKKLTIAVESENIAAEKELRELDGKLVTLSGLPEKLVSEDDLMKVVEAESLTISAGRADGNGPDEVNAQFALIFDRMLDTFQEAGKCKKLDRAEPKLEKKKDRDEPPAEERKKGEEQKKLPKSPIHIFRVPVTTDELLKAMAEWGETFGYSDHVGKFPQYDFPGRIFRSDRRHAGRASQVQRTG